MRIVTITNHQYCHQVVRLAASLRRSNPAAELRVYCPDDDVATRLRICPNVRTAVLAQITNLGAKRAKFVAFDNAIEEGAFLYLDADTLVLADISELSSHRIFAACPDDLSEVPAVINRSHPWPQHPGLQSRLYINSGVFYAPDSFAPELHELARLAANDAEWSRYILPGILYDNHFLCAWLNQWHTQIARMDANIYNWQGLRRNGEIRVFRKQGGLYNKLDQSKQLKIAHFAGIRDIDSFLTTVDPGIGALLAHIGTPPEMEPLSVAFNGLAAIDRALDSRPEDQHFLHVVSAALSELQTVAKRQLSSDWRNSSSYVSDPGRWLALASTTRISTTTWNGLACGGPYLEGDEYSFLRQVVKTTESRSILESGAGETSMLFRSIGCTTTAFEYNDGPWRKRAESAGAKVVMTNLDQAGIPESAMTIAVTAAGPVDLVFIDSPAGGQRRALVANQILRHCKPRYVIFHDAWRDSSEIAAIQESFSLTVLARFPSGRGLVVLGGRTERTLGILTSPSLDYCLTPMDASKVAIELIEAPAFLLPGEHSHARVRVSNRGSLPLSGNCLHPVRIGCHWLTADGASLEFDGIRTELPCSLIEGDELVADIRIQAPCTPGMCLLQADLVQEGILWFSEGTDQSAATSPPIEIRG